MGRVDRPATRQAIARRQLGRQPRDPRGRRLLGWLCGDRWRVGAPCRWRVGCRLGRLGRRHERVRGGHRGCRVAGRLECRATTWRGRRQRDGFERQRVGLVRPDLAVTAGVRSPTRSEQHADALANSASDTDTDADTRPDSTANSHSVACADASPDTDSNPSANADPKANANTDTDSNPSANANPIANACPDANPDRESDSDRHCQDACGWHGRDRQRGPDHLAREPRIGPWRVRPGRVGRDRDLPRRCRRRCLAGRDDGRCSGHDRESLFAADPQARRERDRHRGHRGPPSAVPDRHGKCNRAARRRESIGHGDCHRSAGHVGGWSGDHDRRWLWRRSRCDRTRRRRWPCDRDRDDCDRDRPAGAT